jgi:hypothetical protein
MVDRARLATVVVAFAALSAHNLTLNERCHAPFALALR